MVLGNKSHQTLTGRQSKGCSCTSKNEVNQKNQLIIIQNDWTHIGYKRFWKNYSDCLKKRYARYQREDSCNPDT